MKRIILPAILLLPCALGLPTATVGPDVSQDINQDINKPETADVDINTPEVNTPEINNLDTNNLDTNNLDTDKPHINQDANPDTTTTTTAAIYHRYP